MKYRLVRIDFEWHVKRLTDDVTEGVFQTWGDAFFHAEAWSASADSGPSEYDEDR